MGMFDNYDNLYQNNVPCNVRPNTQQPSIPETKLDPIKTKMPYEDYNVKGELIGYWWHYGDTINLEFNIEGEMVVEGENVWVDATDYLVDKEIIVTLYNFRHEIITQKRFNGSTTVIFPIDRELSKQLVKGVYYASLSISKNDLNDTLFYMEDCVLTVK